MTDSIRPLPTSDWDPSLAPIVDAMRGAPLNVHGLLANHPALLAAWWPLRMHSVKGGTLGERENEIVILRTAVHLECWYEWASHVVRGRDAGLAEDEIEAIISDAGNHQWQESDRLLITAVDELAVNHSVHAATRAELSRYYTDVQLLDVIAVHSVYTMLGKLLNTIDIPIDEQVRQRLPGSVSRHSFVEKLQRRGH